MQKVGPLVSVKKSVKNAYVVTCTVQKHILLYYDDNYVIQV